MKGVLSVFLLSLLWFSLFLPWTSFADPDAFYHAKASLLLWQTGPLLSFPWLDLTSLGTNFSDHLFLFHAVEAPFVALLGLEAGARITALILVSFFLTATYGCMRWLGIKHPAVWIALLALTSPLIVRLLLAKASPLALMLFVIGLAAAWREKNWLVSLATFIFALSHGGWILLVGAIWLMAIGNKIFNFQFPISKNLTSSFQLPASILAPLGGLAGTLIHPNFPENISYLWVQAVKIGLGTPFENIMLGSEWLPPDLSSVISSFAPWIIAFFLGVLGLILSAKKPLDMEAARGVIAFAFPVAAMLALTLKSRRNAEYFAPALALWIPWIWNLVDVKHFFSEIFKQPAAGSRQQGRRNKLKMIGFVICYLLFVVMFIHGSIGAWRGLHNNRYPDDVFQTAMVSISERARPGDRVFHSDWDEFPILFFRDDRLRYIAGLDPTFLYEASSTLSNRYRDLTWGLTSSTKGEAWGLINDTLGSRFVLIDKRDHASLLELIKSDERYIPLVETADAATFEIKKFSP